MSGCGCTISGLRWRIASVSAALPIVSALMPSVAGECPDGVAVSFIMSVECPEAKHLWIGPLEGRLHFPGYGWRLAPADVVPSLAARSSNHVTAPALLCEHPPAEARRAGNRQVCGVCGSYWDLDSLAAEVTFDAS